MLGCLLDAYFYWCSGYKLLGGNPVTTNLTQKKDTDGLLGFEMCLLA